MFPKNFFKCCTETYNFPRFHSTCEGTVMTMEPDREAILEALGKIAFSPPNDAVALALAPEGLKPENLDLWGVSEFKRSGNGAVEIKFADRVKAIGLLLECSGGGEAGMQALLEALEG